MSATIRLTPSDIAWATRIGRERERIASGNGWRHAYGWTGSDPYAPHIQGAAAELAVAKAFGREWEPEFRRPDTADGDVGELQVRSTERRNGCLILHPKDPDEHTYLLVVGKPPTLTIVGSIKGSDGKLPRFWRERTGRPAYFVSQSALRDFNLPDRRVGPVVAPAICAYEAHREFDWRTEDGHDGVRWVCGACHPPPGFLCCDLASRLEGFANRRGKVTHIVRRDPSDPVHSFTAPTRDTVADLMSIIERLTRPSTREEAEDFARDLGAALDRLGVVRGDEFVVAKDATKVQTVATRQAAGSLFDTHHKPGSAITEG